MEGRMRVPGMLYADKKLIEHMEENVLDQIRNVASLPGIVKGSFAMPDAHWGYGFCIGGVAAFDPARGGIVSAGGVGYDIACGVRTLHTPLSYKKAQKRLDRLAEALFHKIPAGVGSTGMVKLNTSQLDEVLTKGCKWAIEQGYAKPDDLETIEENGCIEGANPVKVSPQAKQRQLNQVGTLGSGNHYLEIQRVESIYDENAARAFGIELNDIKITIHCGSRGLGHQIATDYLKTMLKAAKDHGIELAQRELACAPLDSPIGKDYLAAMRCGINTALANRQLLTHLVREVFLDLYQTDDLGILYDVCHNTCQLEDHEVNGKKTKLYVHRKGATRALGPGHEKLPNAYRDAGQPILIGGTMGTCSYILAGTAESENLAFASACHGAGREMSRTQARKRWHGKDIIKHLHSKGMIIKSRYLKGVAEEAPQAYKDVTEVVDAAHNAGLARKVARLVPLACIKG